MGSAQHPYHGAPGRLLHLLARQEPSWDELDVQLRSWPERQGAAHLPGYGDLAALGNGRFHTLMIRIRTPASSRLPCSCLPHGAACDTTAATMSVVRDIRPVAYLKTRAAELIEDVATRRSPVVITQNGKPRAVVRRGYLRVLEQGPVAAQAGGAGRGGHRGRPCVAPRRRLPAPAQALSLARLTSVVSDRRATTAGGRRGSRGRG